MKAHGPREHGVLLLDALGGIAIVALLLTLLTVALKQQHGAAATMQTQRRLDRLAEGVLTDLQQGKAPVPPAWDTEVEPSLDIRVLPNPGPSEGWRWVEVTAKHERLEATLVGAAPEATLSERGPTP